MATHYSTEGIILRSEDRGDADRVFTVFTRDYGKVSLWAIAERKIASKLRGGLELFSLSDLEFIEGKNRKVVTDTATIERHRAIKENTSSLYVAYRIADLVDFLSTAQELDEQLWNLLVTTFSVLDKSGLPYTPFYYYFLWNALEIVGYQPSIDHCSECSLRFANMLQYVYSLVRDKERFWKKEWNEQEKEMLSDISHHYLSQFVS